MTAAKGASDLLHQGILRAQSGDKPAARALFERLAEEQPTHETVCFGWPRWRRIARRAPTTWPRAWPSTRTTSRRANGSSDSGHSPRNRARSRSRQPGAVRSARRASPPGQPDAPVPSSPGPLEARGFPEVPGSRGRRGGDRAGDRAKPHRPRPIANLASSDPGSRLPQPRTPPEGSQPAQRPGSPVPGRQGPWPSGRGSNRAPGVDPGRRETPEAMPAATETEPEPAYNVETQEIAPRQTVLVVDDSLTVRRLLSETLEKGGYEIMLAANGMEALARIQEMVPDLVILDVTMPSPRRFQDLPGAQGERTHEARTGGLPVGQGRIPRQGAGAHGWRRRLPHEARLRRRAARSRPPALRPLDHRP